MMTSYFMYNSNRDSILLGFYRTVLW